MAKLPMPESIRKGLLGIDSLTNEQFQDLYSSLENLPLRLTHQGVFDYDTLKTESISSNVLSSIREALFPLYLGQARTNVHTPAYVDSITDSLREETRDEQDAVSEEAITRIKERLARLLNAERPRLISKAHDVLVEQTPAYSEGRILTDIRPIFSDNIDEAPQAAVLVHVLKINYYKDGNEQDFIIALDAKDIQDLIDTLERAKKKTETLLLVTSSVGMNVIDVV